MTEKTCSEEHCDKKALARGLCRNHYAQRVRKAANSGVPLPPKTRTRKEPPQCSVEGCEKRAMGRGWCSKHYYHWQKFGDPLKSAPPRLEAACSIEDCGKPAEVRGWCDMHYTRWLRNGDPLVVQYIRGNDRIRFEMNVDRSGGPDACHPWTGSKCSGGYGQISVNGKLQLAHVMAWQYATGREKPPKSNIDHECHNRAVREGACQPGECPHRLCCNGAHLAAKTTRQHRDDTQQWEMPTGYRPKLTEEQRAEIRVRLAAGETGRSIARHFGVHPATITHIKQGRR